MTVSVVVRGLPAPRSKLEESRRLAGDVIAGNQLAHAAIGLVDQDGQRRQIGEIEALEVVPLLVGVPERLLEAGRVEGPARFGCVGPDGGCQVATPDAFDGLGVGLHVSSLSRKTVMVTAPHSSLGAVTVAVERDAGAGAQKAERVTEARADGD